MTELPTIILRALELGAARPERTVKRDDTRTPEVDWTGHHYKSPRDCIKAGIDYNHRGRESTGR